MTQWQKTVSGSQRRMQPGTAQSHPGGAGPTLGQHGTRYLGRIVLEAWEPSDPSDDGVVYTVTMGSGATDLRAVDRFVRDVAQRLLKRQNLGG